MPAVREAVSRLAHERPLRADIVEKVVLPKVQKPLKAAGSVFV